MRVLNQDGYKEQIMSKKKYSLHEKPLEPYPPTRTYQQREVTFKQQLYLSAEVPTLEQLNGATHMDAIISRQYYSDDYNCCIEYYKMVEVPNINYEKEYQEYLKNLEKHKKDVAGWEEWKKEWDEKEVQKNKKMELNKLKNLMKKYKDDSELISEIQKYKKKIEG